MGQIFSTLSSEFNFQFSFTFLAKYFRKHVCIIGLFCCMMLWWWPTKTYFYGLLFSYYCRYGWTISCFFGPVQLFLMPFIATETGPCNSLCGGCKPHLELDGEYGTMYRLKSFKLRHTQLAKVMQRLIRNCKINFFSPLLSK